MMEDADTPELVPRDDTRAEYQDATVSPGERAEIVVGPPTPMQSPVLYVSTYPQDAARDVIVEDVYHGRIAVTFGLTTAHDLRGSGLSLSVLATRDSPVKVVVMNGGNQTATVGASLVVREPREPIGD